QGESRFMRHRFLKHIASAKSIERTQFLKAFRIESRRLRIRRDGGANCAGIAGRHVRYSELASEFRTGARNQIEQLRLASNFREGSDSFARSRVLQSQSEPHFTAA